MNTATTIAETTEAARRMVRTIVTGVSRRDVIFPAFNDRPAYIAAALAQAMVDADLTPEQVERIEATVQRYFE